MVSVSIHRSCVTLRTTVEIGVMNKTAVSDIHVLPLILLVCTVRLSGTMDNKNSSGDEIANVNFFYNIAHVEASAYAH